MRVVIAGILALSFSSSLWAVENVIPSPAPGAETVAPANAPTAPPQTLPAHRGGVVPVNTTVPTVAQTLAAQQANVAPTAEELAKNKAQQEAKVKAMVKDQATRLQQLEKANLEALAQNQELQLKNDNLGVQVQVLQSERSAQMFLYGAATLAVGVLLGFLIASYVYTKRRRQW